MNNIWILVILQSLFLGFLLLPSNSEPESRSQTRYLESLRHSACNSALVSQSCLDFQRPSPSSCRLGFTFSALIDLRLRLTDLTSHFSAPGQAKFHESIQSKQEMLETLAYSFSTGRAAEFRVPQDLFLEILSVIETLENWRTLGGNGAMMSYRAAHEGCSSTLIAPITQEMTQYFPHNVKFLNKFVEQPDLHIILEYREGERWGKYNAPRSNRFYMNHDTQNTNPEIMSSGFELAEETKVLVIGGLQLIENSGAETEFLEKALALSHKVHEKGIKTHIEMGDFHSYAFFKKLQPLFAVADSIGMNEQELGILLCHLKKIKFAGYPSKAPIKKYLDDLSDLLSELPVNNYQASRIHLHTIYSQVICSNEVWGNPLIASARSAIIAGQFACNNTDIQQTSFRFYEGEDWAQEDTTKCWKNNNMQCCLALVPTCLNVVQVSGLGDNISATGLVYHNIR